MEKRTTRRKKIALIGCKGWDQSTDVVVHCHPWESLSTDLNFRDYDVLVMSLLSVPNNVDWDVFRELLNTGVTYDILSHDGAIVVLGDPRFDVPTASTKEPFLSWCGWIFEWDDRQGDSVEVASKGSAVIIDHIQKFLKRWTYSLRRCRLKDDQFGIAPLSSLKTPGLRFESNLISYATNRYGGHLAFSIYFSIDRKVTEYMGERWDPIITHGPIILFPQMDLSEDEMILFALRDFLGVATELKEPDWLSAYAAPGQQEAEQEIAELNAEIQNLEAKVRKAGETRNEARKPLRLLYDRGQSLERVVRTVLCALGAEVEDPEDPTKEDGWIVVKVPNGHVFEGCWKSRARRTTSLTRADCANFWTGLTEAWRFARRSTREFSWA